jgi:hypothetical protein
MIKSYQESNGTALSTDWSDVSKVSSSTLPPPLSYSLTNDCELFRGYGRSQKTMATQPPDVSCRLLYPSLVRELRSDS